VNEEAAALPSPEDTPPVGEQEHYKTSRWDQQFLPPKQVKKRGGGLKAAREEYGDTLPGFKNSFLSFSLSWQRDAGG